MRITVFTSTYNRANTIGKLYISLKMQSFTDFEWLVIDDGSTDETKILFDSWKHENNNFEIRYYYYKNSGKQKEINRALDLARGELFFTVDSDDLLTQDALEKIDNWEKTLPSNNNYCGFAGSDGDFNGKPTNPIFKEKYFDATFLNRYPESGHFIGYDRPWVFYTEIHRKYKYPEFEGENFIAEAVVWNRMAKDGYLIRCFNDVIYLWEHQTDGLTDKMSQTLINNPNGYGLWISELMDIMKYSIKQKIVKEYIVYCDLKGTYDYKQIAKFLRKSPWKLFVIEIVFRIKHGVFK